jgi:hypothetical protein
VSGFADSLEGAAEEAYVILRALAASMERDELSSPALRQRIRAASVALSRFVGSGAGRELPHPIPAGDGLSGTQPAPVDSVGSERVDSRERERRSNCGAGRPDGPHVATRDYALVKQALLRRHDLDPDGLFDAETDIAAEQRRAANSQARPEP